MNDTSSRAECVYQGEHKNEPSLAPAPWELEFMGVCRAGSKLLDQWV